MEVEVSIDILNIILAVLLLSLNKRIGTLLTPTSLPQKYM
jgi:hypothetical protein